MEQESFAFIISVEKKQKVISHSDLRTRASLSSVGSLQSLVPNLLATKDPTHSTDLTLFLKFPSAHQTFY